MLSLTNASASNRENDHAIFRKPNVQTARKALADIPAAKSVEVNDNQVKLRQCTPKTPTTNCMEFNANLMKESPCNPKTPTADCVEFNENIMRSAPKFATPKLIEHVSSPWDYLPECTNKNIDQDVYTCVTMNIPKLEMWQIMEKIMQSTEPAPKLPNFEFEQVALPQPINFNIELEKIDKLPDVPFPNFELDISF